ncbi:hypothetical protein DACRYDRAFT_113231 [Dacryopinax primogenitus]|uniref:Alpha/beta-hydrolase n=1 Tax=Dacryopinax primogenitus (strain DJM 731) TaxID=1858805 RepID=M5G8L4_DACPD|nr:uncharacterized protein DACRYDRAFT_113231 [Dacryopinax primogenitus]EJU06556.1 hypothetical protein DACRYDRAFT_113231 [Dacryopinax primogenitus]
MHKLHAQKVPFPGLEGEVLRYSSTVVVRPAQREAGAGEPGVVLIMRWMDAADAHAAKYMSAYTQLYPGSTQVVVSSPQKLLWLGEAYREQEMGVVQQVLEEQGVLGRGQQGEGKGLLLHVFSNGGCLTLISLCKRILAYRALPTSPSTAADDPAPPQPALPAKAIIYDSCPAPITLPGGATAFSMIFPPPVRGIAWYAIYGLLLLVRGVNGLLGYPDSVGRMREELLSPLLLPDEAQRVYVYGTGDRIVPFEEVEEMVELERRRGRKVRQERFEGSGHVLHVRSEPGRYWECVKRVWEEAQV